MTKKVQINSTIAHFLPPLFTLVGQEESERERERKRESKENTEKERDIYILNLM